MPHRMYLNNYELYSSRESMDSRRSPPPDNHLLNPLATLYPHVVNMQPQSSHNFDGYRETGYFVAAYTTNSNQPWPRPSSPSPAGNCQPPYRRFVSKIKRLLSRDDLKSSGRQLKRPDTAHDNARPSTAWSSIARPTTARPTTSRGLQDFHP